MRIDKPTMVVLGTFIALLGALIGFCIGAVPGTDALRKATARLDEAHTLIHQAEIICAREEP
jgi:membrane protein DedA with SNARE-associated domain